jgi:hypothetical protein
MNHSRESEARPDDDREQPSVEPDSGTGAEVDPYAREAAIEQLTGPENADD